MPYSIALLDDHRVVLESFANLLATSGKFEVVGIAHDIASLRAVLASSAVDVLVSDLVMPNQNGADLIPALKAQYPELRVLILSGADDAELIRRAIRAGADGFVTKTADKTELFDALLTVASGRRYVDSRLYDFTESAALTPDTLLTEREAEVARLIIDELSSMQIAERLFISFNTVETHRKHIYQKLGVTTSLGLMKYVLKHGLR
ncbi:response regulator [Spirosoma montaniterrae]|uniref:LuxR family transcriptional regulator n=1 Tax=Spirosoma montaniterrae TaxID=1178516 RepID=A0A1P9WZR4_9BACT|nr:response regulator transcription factor [Spirosoma montaniterrae]AQG80876.1 hypothetical protein AWR27_17050 [Spirosoma montaniterrae]